METKSVEEEIQTEASELRVDVAILKARFNVEKREKSWWVGASYGMLAVMGGLFAIACKTR